MSAMRIPGRRFHRARSAATLGIEPHELELQSHIRVALEGINCHVTNLSQSRRSTVTPGCPDLWFCHAAWGISGFVEVKRPGETRSPDQRRWHAINQTAGVVVLTVESAEDAVALVSALPRRKR